MQTVARNNFVTVKTEGGILPADLLQRIADGEVEGLKPTDYHLAASDRLNEAINRSWLHLLGRWRTFGQKMADMAESETGTTLTRDWMMAVLQELGYGRLPYQGKLTISSGEEELAYPISHLYDHTPIHMVTFRQQLDRRDESQAVKRSPHSLMQEFLNRSDDHLWGFISNGLRLRIMRDNISLTRAAYVEFDLEAMFDGELYSDFTIFWLLCHQSRIEIRDQRVETDDQSPVSTLQSPTACWLERWSQAAAEQGTRALDSLRDGVQEAIAALGRGFLAHKGNQALRQNLQSGELSTADYYRQLLRMVYRLLFLFVAEDRDLLLLPEADAAARLRYDQFYSVARLRRLAEKRRGGPHPDLYRGLRLLFAQLRTGYAPLALPGLGGFLFSERATPDLDAADIANVDLLNAIRALAFSTEGKVRRPVDYKNLGSEELGSVYESLLELHPRLHVGAATFSLDVAAGSERKTTGSYYTPSSLIQSLLDSALEPVVADRLRVARSELQGQNSPPATRHLQHLSDTILDIKVVDPACGSGHFLIGAARRLARHLARVRTGDDEPGPEAVRHALRDVVGRCIYGVDINEMSVELCKVALWLETLDPGRPLSFLDANIQCGNSLMGTTPALLAGGIPDAAFTPITGDDKAYCTEWKKQNKAQQQQGTLFSGDMQPWDRLGDFATAMRQLSAGGDETLADVQAREAQYVRLTQSSDYEYGKLWADAWCAAFVWMKRGETRGSGESGVGSGSAATPNSLLTTPSAKGWPYPITEQVFRNLERSPHREPKWLKDEVARLAEAYQFFHWHLAFPQVFVPREDLTSLVNLSNLDGDEDVTGWTGGFDVVLGNPPWERIKLQEKEWFASRDEAIATAPNAAARRKLIAQLPQTNPEMHEAFEADKRKAEGESAFVRNSGKYPLCGRGDVNTYTLFAELSRHVQSNTGRVGVIVPSGIATDDTTKYYFQDIIDSGALVSLYDFENNNIFPGVHRSYKFCLLTLTGVESAATAGAQFVFFAQDVADLRDEERRFTLSAADIALLNPNTRTCPIFRSKRDAELTKAIYRRMPVLIAEGPPEVNPWGIKFFTMFHMSSDSGLFRTREQLEETGWQLTGNRFVRDGAVYLPLYEAKMLHHFDHRWATYDGLETRDVTGTEKDDQTRLVLARYWVREEEVKHQLNNKWQYDWLVGFRRVCRSTDERSGIFDIFPVSGAGDSIFLIATNNQKPSSHASLLGGMDSFVFDFVTRQKAGGINLNFFIAQQLPVLPPQTYHQPCLWLPNLPSPISAFLLPRVLELTYTAYDLRSFAQDCGYHGPPFRWDEGQPGMVGRRFLLRCELDAAYFHLYGIEREDVAYIMDTFPIVRRKDEAAHGEYRTKRVILEIYDEMAEASGQWSVNSEQSLSPTDKVSKPKPYQTRLDPPPAHPDAAHPWDEAYLGTELPREQWWALEERLELKDEGGGMKDEVGSPPATRDTPSITVREPAPTLELKPPPVKQPKAKPKAAPALSAQPALVSEFTPPAGGYGQRLKRVMALGNPKNQAELAELVAALGDENTNIRWLAGGSLTKIGGLVVVNLLAAFVQSNPGAKAEDQARKTLEMIAETSEDAGVQTAAKKINNSNPTKPY